MAPGSPRSHPPALLLRSKGGQSKGGFSQGGVHGDLGNTPSLISYKVGGS